MNESSALLPPSGRLCSFVRRVIADSRGGALVLALLVSVIVLGLGAVALTVSRTEVNVSSNYQRGLSAKYFAESDLRRVVGQQNDLTASPRYLFAPASYQYRATGPNDTSRLAVRNAVSPLPSGNQTLGTVQTSVLGKDPVVDSPPYTLQSTATLSDGTSTTYQAVVDVLSLLDFALFSDEDVYIAPDIVIGGRVYSGGLIGLTGPIATFLQRVEYVRGLQNPSFGDFRQGRAQIQPLPSIPALVDLTFFESASKNAGVCSNGRGLFIGQQGPAVVRNQARNVFRAYKAGGSGSRARKQRNQSRPGCRDQDWCYAIDLGLFDFTARPITYAGVPLVGFDGNPLTDFNGVIWTDAEVHVWGHLGGRSVEDNTITDSRNYMTPKMISYNRYSNNVLDAGEDGSNGGVLNGKLDPGNKGVNLGIYAKRNLYIDHNIFAGTDSIGNPVRLGLVARDYVRIDSYSPRVIIVQAAVLAVEETWRPAGNQSSHRPNDWANNNGAAPPNTYVYDMNQDGVIQSNNGASRRSDRNETRMRYAWTLRNLGNLVVRERPSSGPWTAVRPPHPRFYLYDTQLQTAEIPCYPTLPSYGIVPGSFTEITAGLP
ncbi:MAG: pilus assembly PilX N-terminal domain-containing protein, partial [Gemmatimonadota bacterium]